MSSEKNASAETAGSRPSASRPARKKRRVFKRALLLIFLTATAGIAFAPQIIVRTTLRNSLIAQAAPELDGKLILGQTSLGWLSPIEVEQVQLLHADGERWATIENLKSQYSLLDLILEPSDLGHWTASHCEVTAVCEPGSTDAERWLQAIQSDTESTPAVLSFASENLQLTLKSEGVESNFQLTNAAWQQTRAGDLSFQFQASPIEGEHPLPQSLSVDARFDEGVSWDVLGSDFLLQQLEPLLVRFEIEEKIASQWNGQLKVTQDRESAWHIETNGTLDQLLVSRAGEQLANAEHLELNLDATQNSLGWHVSTLAGKTDFGEVTLVGAIDLQTSAQSWNESLIQLLDQSFALNGTIDLGELTRRFPSLLTLQQGVKLNRGTGDFQIESRPKNKQRRLTAALDVSEIDAETPTQPLRWDHPFHANATLVQENSFWKVEDLKIDSNSVTLTGKGTWQSAELDADIDLAAFQQEWNQIFDLGELQLSGTLKAHAESKLQTSRQIELNGNLTGRDLIIGWGNSQPWELASLKGDLEGAGQLSEAGQLELSSFKGTLHTEKELLTLTRINPEADHSPDRQHWQLSGSGDLSGLAGQLLSRTSTVRTIGQYRVETEWLRDANTEQFQKLNLDLSNFECQLDSVRIAEPELKITGDLTVQKATSQITSSELVVNCPTVAARVRELVLSTDNGLRVNGKIAARGRVERLWQYANPESTSQAPTGILNLQLSATAEKNDSTGLNWKLTTDELRWPAATNGNPVRPVSTSGSTPTNVNRTIQPEWTGSGRYLPQSDQLVTEQSQLTSDAVNFSLQGGVSSLTSSPVATIEGVCQYDWEQLTLKYPGLLGEELKLYGSHQSPVKLTIPLTSDSSDRERMAGSVSLMWDRGEWNALPIGPGTLSVDLTPQRMTVRPLEVAVAGGTARFGPMIERSSQGSLLLQQPERLIDRVQLTDEICQQWLKYVSPLTADAARVRGSFTVDNTQLIQVPLDRWQQMTAEGLVQIHSAEMRPGPLAMQFITLSKQIEALRRGTPFDPQAADANEPVMTITRQTVPCKVEKGRVYHRDLTIELRDLTITSSGSVGFDDSLDLVAQIQIPEKWKVRGKPVREIWGASIKIPIRGSFSRPQMDLRVIQSLMDQLVRGTVTNFLEEELNKQLNKLFQP